MQRHIRPAAQKAAPANTRDPIPDAIGDSLWLGGEALIAPAYCEVSWPARCVREDADADPGWQVI